MEEEGKKSVRYVPEGDFSDSTQNKSYLYAKIIANKESAGKFLLTFYQILTSS